MKFWNSLLAVLLTSALAGCAGEIEEGNQPADQADGESVGTTSQALACGGGVAGEQLLRGQSTRSCNGVYELRMDASDGRTALWKGTSKIYGFGSPDRVDRTWCGYWLNNYTSCVYWYKATPFKLIMQADGNLVLYSHRYRMFGTTGTWSSDGDFADWSSGTKVAGSWLQITDDGKLKILSPSGSTLWKKP